VRAIGLALGSDRAATPSTSAPAFQHGRPDRAGPVGRSRTTSSRSATVSTGGDIRHCVADPARASCWLRGGHHSGAGDARSAGWLADREAVDRVEDATRQLAARGLAHDGVSVRPLCDGRTDVADLAIVIVSTNEAHWLERCLSTVYDRAGGAGSR
jgi:hypothetical protein